MKRDRNKIKDAHKKKTQITSALFFFIWGNSMFNTVMFMDMFLEYSEVVKVTENRIAKPVIQVKEIPVEQVESTLPAPTEELSVEEQIREVAQENGFDDPDLLVDIAFCESSLNPQATNGTSSATGLFQILDMHGLTVAERKDVATSTEWTISKIEKGGLNAWNASKHCWSA